MTNACPAWSSRQTPTYLLKL